MSYPTPPICLQVLGKQQAERRTARRLELGAILDPVSGLACLAAASLDRHMIAFVRIQKAGLSGVGPGCDAAT
jgi:hypothetical protein